MSKSRLFRIIVAIAALPGLALVLLLHGAIPGAMVPSYGQSIWAIGFAKAITNDLSIFAHGIGGPAPAAIAFGLPAVLTMVPFLAIGLSDGDAYSTSFAIWLVAAYWGTFRLSRQIGVGHLFAITSAIVWMTIPVIWMHQGYSMLGLGMSLVPFYVSFAWPIAWRGPPTLYDFGAFTAATTIAAFMDGYTFVISAMVAGCLWFAGAVTGEPKEVLARRLTMLAVGYGAAYLLYNQFTGSSGTEGFDLDFFRGWGANIEFLLVPPSGLLWIPDTLGLSESRAWDDYFGDPSVFTTPFALLVIILSVIAVASRKGDRRAVWAFFLIGLVGLYLSLGPSFKFYAMRPSGVAGPVMSEDFAPIPTGTGFLSTYVPGFMAMRASYRWVVLGMLGMWAAFVASMAGRRSLTGCALPLGVAVIALHMPYSSRIGGHSNQRDMHLLLAEFAEKVRPSFRPNEKTLFLPWGNDFFVTYLAPTIGIQSFNIGGDKNLGAAVANWPDSIRAIPMRKPLSVDYVIPITTMLTSGDVDAVALSFIDNTAPVNNWPVPQDNKAAALELAEALETNPALLVARTEDYVIIRLR
ncbi:hypothetical protein FJ936_27310 [Mesorhizobium sp. B2-4-13]|uniref:hypothetical protein n=1 Tax=Mesorhizobium sp. B2-4-13 TaxID=2589936 RepID=UPI0011541474|nr:hypothetical protein [Mesorhizobium sp. B2-4-13]TPK81212.1 hypothetical protein FJ936_27310 [Mesorhizobium sp. B2-4-13]